MMKDTMIIRVVVERITEGKDTYFLATSPDIEGFIAEADTYDEIKSITPELIKDMIISRIIRDKIQENKKKKEIEIDLNYSFSPWKETVSLCY